MRRAGVFFRALSISAICIFSTCCQAAAEEITISTYYPSPYGSYEELRSNKMVIGQEADGSVIPAPPMGGLTLAPQSQGVIDALTNVPKGTLMYNQDIKEFTYYDGSKWREMVVQKDGVDIGTAYYSGLSDIHFGTWRQLTNISMKKQFTEPVGNCGPYAQILTDRPGKMYINTECPSIVGSGFHQVTWGGKLGADANDTYKVFLLRLRTNSNLQGASTVDSIEIKDEKPYDPYQLSTLEKRNKSYYEKDVEKINTVVVRSENFRQYWIEVKTEGGSPDEIAGKISDKEGLELYIKVEKMAF